MTYRKFSPTQFYSLFPLLVLLYISFLLSISLKDIKLYKIIVIMTDCWVYTIYRLYMYNIYIYILCSIHLYYKYVLVCLYLFVILAFLFILSSSLHCYCVCALPSSVISLLQYSFVPSMCCYSQIYYVPICCGPKDYI